MKRMKRRSKKYDKKIISLNHICISRSETLKPCRCRNHNKTNPVKIRTKNKLESCIPEEGKGSFHEGLWRLKAEGEEEEVEQGTSEGMRFRCKELWFWGKLKLRLKPRSSFSTMVLVWFEWSGWVINCRSRE